jgi:aldose sugar dehydrogenase
MYSVMNVFVVVAGTLAIVLFPSQLFLGDSIWNLSRTQLVFLAGIALACLVSAAVATVGPNRPASSRAARTAMALLASFGGLGLWLVLSRGFHSRPLLLAALTMTALLCALVLLRQRKVVASVLGVIALGSVVAQLAGDRPGHALALATGAEVGARHKQASLGSSLHALKADVFLDYFCAEPTPECPAPRFGGGLTPAGDGFLIATGDGQLYFATYRGGRALQRQELAYRAPLNAKQFLNGSLDGGGVLFRVADVAVQEDGNRWRIFVSHHYWHADRQCFVLRVSSLEGTQAELLGPPGDLQWRTVFETQPCLPVLEPLPHSVHKGRVFSGDESGGKMVLLAPNTMLLTVGDHLFNGYDRKESVAQDPNAQFGKTLRIDLSSGKAEVFTLGHRNPQGLAVTSEGAVWLTEHGPRGGDELNQLRQGLNYGWPLVTYGTDYGSEVWAPNARQGDHEGFERSVYAWVPSVAVSSILVPESRLFPGWRGDLLIGSYSQRLWRMRIRDERVAFAEPIDVRALGSGRIRDLAEDKQGRIVLWIDGGTLAFLSPQGGLAPNATAAAGTNVKTSADLFLAKCGSCHQVGTGAMSGAGPVLNQIVDRPIASNAEFGYSSSLKSVGGAWTEEQLHRFLENPQRFAPGTTMMFAGIGEPEERQTIINHLKAQQ